jgi:hypothetical protein
VPIHDENIREKINGKERMRERATEKSIDTYHFR